MKTVSAKAMIWTGLGTLIVGLILGWAIFGNRTDRHDAGHTTEMHDHEAGTVWTCSMHPQIRATEPGKCPICGMDLVQVRTDDQGQHGDMVVLNENAIRLANVQTTVVGRSGNHVREVRLNGKVSVDERQVHSQTTHVTGRVEQLGVNFTGEYVRRGQTLAILYSPELVTAQQELLEAYKFRETQPALYQAARDKLKNWKLSDGNIDDLISKGETTRSFGVVADASGVVVEKKVNKGDYVSRGQTLYEIANLSRIWVLLDLYEMDIPWVRVGDKVTFGVRSLPGQTFEGEITYVDPVIDPQTRVASGRVEMLNPEMTLKPGMFVTGVVQAVPGQSDALVVPATAVLWTGERSVVYVKQNADGGTGFQMRVVTLGPTTGGGYVVKEGLRDGEEIVTNGTFAVDAAAQLEGKSSMMNQPGHTQDAVDNQQQRYPSVDRLLDWYLNLKDALVADNFNEAKKRAGEAAGILEAVNMNDFTPEGHDEWMKHYVSLRDIVNTTATSSSIGDMRKHFITLSNRMISIAQYFGTAAGETLYIQHCPMADSNQGADWLSKDAKVRNPYFGSAMLMCGEVTGEISRQ